MREFRKSNSSIIALYEEVFKASVKPDLIGLSLSINANLQSLLEEIAAIINNLNRDLIKKEIMLKNTNYHLQELQEKLRERTQELEAKNIELEKISNDKSKILGIVAHDLRSPIGGIFGLSEYIHATAKEMISQEPVRCAGLEVSLEFSELIIDSSKYLLDLINDLLDVSAIETRNLVLNLESINYLPFSNKVVGVHKELAKNKNIVILSRLEIEDSLTIRVDKIKISQVVLGR